LADYDDDDSVGKFDLSNKNVQKFLKDEADADMDNFFGDNGEELSDDDAKMPASNQSVASDSSDEILASWVKKRPKCSSNTSANRRCSGSTRNKSSQHNISTSSRQLIDRSCPYCVSTDCHNVQLGDFLEKHLDNHGMENNKTTMTQQEVYTHITKTYNTILHHRTHIVTREVGYGSVSLPTCLYMGTFQKVWKKWSVDVRKAVNERRSHQNWLTSREQDIARQRRRRANFSSI
jgi:hypothetical protein